MKRRTMLAALGTVALAGCVSNPTSDGDGNGTGGGDDNETGGGTDEGRDQTTVLDHFDGSPTRPECERESETVEIEIDGESREFETVATVPYPDPPAAFDDGSIVDYVEAFERAYVHHDVLCGRTGSGYILRVGYDVAENEVFRWDTDPTVVCLLRAGAASRGVNEEGAEWVADLAYSGVVYAVDDTGVARVEFEDAVRLEPHEFEGEAPNPLEDGTLVASFE